MCSDLDPGRKAQVRSRSRNQAHLGWGQWLSDSMVQLQVEHRMSHPRIPQIPCSTGRGTARRELQQPSKVQEPGTGPFLSQFKSDVAGKPWFTCYLIPLSHTFTTGVISSLKVQKLVPKEINKILSFYTKSTVRFIVHKNCIYDIKLSWGEWGELGKKEARKDPSGGNNEK